MFHTSVLSHGCNNRDVDTPPMTQVTYKTTSPPMTVVSENNEKSNRIVKKGVKLDKPEKEPELNQRYEINKG